MLAALSGTAGQGEAQATGTVRGTVYDSTAAAPLVDAAVFLWDTQHRTETDSAGRFVLDDVPAGEYSLVFFHTRLGQMGVSPGPRPVTVRGGETVEAALTTPSFFTLTASQCLHEGMEPGKGVVAGWVGDAETGMGLPGARITLSWPSGRAGEPERRYYQADGSGWYRACTAPAGVPITASARFLDRVGLRREVTVAEGRMTEAAFLLRPLSPTRVAGTLVDATSGQPVSDAEVWLRGTATRELTDDRGRFEFEEVQPGSYMLVADHLAYGTKMDTLEVPSGERILVEMRVDTRPIEIAPLTVTVDAQPVTERIVAGITVDRVAIDKVRDRVRDVADILKTQSIPGLIVQRQDNILCIGFMPGQIRMMFRNTCVPMVVVIDNVRATNTDLAVQLSPDAIERIVIYRPIEAGNLYGLGGGNGVLAIFTRGH